MNYVGYILYILDKTYGHFNTRYNKKYFACYTFRLSFLCIQGGRVNGVRIYKRCCAIFWLQQTGTRADKKGNAYSCELSYNCALSIPNNFVR